MYDELKLTGLLFSAVSSPRGWALPSVVRESVFFMLSF